MAGMGPAPKPDAERRRTNASTFSWTYLPAAGRKGKTPVLPKWRVWHPETVAWWRRLWVTPQASQWKDDGSTLFVLAALYDDLIAGRADVARVSAEMRQHEDRHGLNPKAMLQLRWRLDDGEQPAAAPLAAKRRGKPAKVVELDPRRQRVMEQLGHDASA